MPVVRGQHVGRRALRRRHADAHRGVHATRRTRSRGRTARASSSTCTATSGSAGDADVFRRRAQRRRRQRAGQRRRPWQALALSLRARLHVRRKPTRRSSTATSSSQSRATRSSAATRGTDARARATSASRARARRVRTRIRCSRERGRRERAGHAHARLGGEPVVAARIVCAVSELPVQRRRQPERAGRKRADDHSAGVRLERRMGGALRRAIDDRYRASAGCPRRSSQGSRRSARRRSRARRATFAQRIPRAPAAGVAHVGHLGDDPVRRPTVASRATRYCSPARRTTTTCAISIRRAARFHVLRRRAAAMPSSNRCCRADGSRTPVSARRRLTGFPRRFGVKAERRTIGPHPTLARTPTWPSPISSFRSARKNWKRNARRKKRSKRNSIARPLNLRRRNPARHRPNRRSKKRWGACHAPLNPFCARRVASHGCSVARQACRPVIFVEKLEAGVRHEARPRRRRRDTHHTCRDSILPRRRRADSTRTARRAASAPRATRASTRGSSDAERGTATRWRRCRRSCCAGSSSVQEVLLPALRSRCTRAPSRRTPAAPSSPIATWPSCRRTCADRGPDRSRNRGCVNGGVPSMRVSSASMFCRTSWSRVPSPERFGLPRRSARAWRARSA